MLARGGGRGRDGTEAVRGAVQVAVAATHRTRPGLGAHAGQHAAWWARNADTLALIADHEADPVRAEAARADAVTAQRLAEGMASAHVAQVVEPRAARVAGPVPVPVPVVGDEVAVGGPDLVDLAGLGEWGVGL
jgi:hypothetical protein